MSEAPTDRRFDRRAFLGYMGALTAAAGGGALGIAGSPPVLSAVTRGGGETAPPPVRLPDGPPAQAVDSADLTVAEASRELRAGRLSPLELVDACLARIQALDPVYLAFNATLPDEARALARAMTGRGPGALHGIPLALKDNYFTAGVPTTANSHIFRDFVPEFDAESWRRLRAHGAVLVGKTQMGPLATSHATTPDGDNTTLNAWAPDDPSVSPGGSSSGSATAVATGMALVATGTQTGGSITSPALEQGLTGLKPTMGRVSLRGVIPLTYTRDHPGPLARDAMDAAIMLQVMAGEDAGDPRTLGHPPVADYVSAATPVRRGGATVLRWPTRIGVLPGDGERPEQAAMLRTFEDLGAEIVEIEAPQDWEVLTSSDFNNVRLPERAEPFMEQLRSDVRLFGVSLAPWVNGLLLPGTEYLRGQRAKLLLLRRVLDGVFSQCDVVVQRSPIPFDMIGLPLIAFPTARRDDEGVGRPTGVMLGAAPFAEDRLLSLVAAYQDVTEWHRLRAPLPGRAGAESEGGERQAIRPLGPGERGRTTVSEVMALGE